MDPVELTATQFIRPMSTGRNHPMLLGCENAAGEKFEVVVKFRGQEMDSKAQMAELLAALLADDLGLQVPQAAIVNVPPGFEAIIPNAAEASHVKGSQGMNFGSLNIGPGFTTWPPGRNPVGAQRDQAADIFAFDALVQNPDRRAENPNLWARSDRLGVYDHEQAFSFLRFPIIGGAPRPWVPASHGNSFGFLQKHVFYANLRGGRLNLGPFKEKLGVLTDQRIQAYLDTVPAEWTRGADFGGKVAEYLREARQNRDDLINFIKHKLQ